MTQAHPFPLPEGNACEWTARDWQRAANFYWYELAGIDRSEPNYKPMETLLKSAHAHAMRKAKALREIPA